MMRLTLISVQNCMHLPEICPRTPGKRGFMKAAFSGERKVLLVNDGLPFVRKVALNLLIWFICGCAVFVIAVLGVLICPTVHETYVQYLRH
jgi:hypothetical protein